MVKIRTQKEIVSEIEESSESEDSIEQHESSEAEDNRLIINQDIRDSDTDSESYEDSEPEAEDDEFNQILKKTVNKYGLDKTVDLLMEKINLK
ncbi:MAG TPA: hypothetical protein VK590_02045 [Saprospiraceae bacterium]|nr:hypothetical protein [Saprospiraceae bacterium]